MKAIVLASQRSGSTFLAKCLNSHTQIRSLYMELFLNRNWKDFVPLLWQAGHQLDEYLRLGKIPEKRLQILEKNRQARRSTDEIYNVDDVYNIGIKPVMAAKVMHNQMLASPSLDRYVVSHSAICIIHLHRRNLLKQHVSNMLNKQNAKFSRLAHTTKPVSAVQIQIDPKTAIWRMRWSRWLHKWYDRRLANHPKITVTYEEMVGKKGLACNVTTRILEFLELPYEPLTTDLVKINPDNLQEIVTNYDELAQALRGTEFEQFLEN